MNDLENGRPGSKHPRIVKGGKEGIHVDTKEGGGGSVVQVGISEKALFIVVLCTLGIALLTSITAVVISVVSLGVANLSSNQAMLAERNSKQAQYQLEESLKKAEK